MADNVVLDPGAGGATIATDDDGTAQHQYVKVEFGADNTQSKVSSSNGLPVTPDTGGFEVSLSAVDNAVLDAIAASVAILDDVVSGSEAQVDVVSSALPSGASTAANQTTIIGHVDGIEALLTTIDADTSDIHTNSDTIAAGFAAEGSALGSGVLLQGDDGTDRTNVLVDTAGHLQVDVVSSALPTGAATAANQSTANTALSAIQTAVEILDNVVSGSEAQVDVVTSALPTGAATSANQSTIIGHVDGIEGLLGTIDTDTGTISTNTTTLAGAVRSEDAAHSSGHDGIPALAVRSDTLASLAGATNDYTMLQANEDGALYVQDVGGPNNGLTKYRNVDVDETEDQVSSTGVTLYTISAQSIDATPIYLHFYNATAASVTVGTTTPDLTFIIPSQGDGNGAGLVLDISKGWDFDTALSIAATTTVGGTTGPGANEVIVNLGYK